MKKIFEITKSILSDINKYVDPVDPNEGSSDISKLRDYFLEKDCPFYCQWTNSHGSESKPVKRIIFRRLHDLTLNIEKETGLQWMTFMIQNPESSISPKSPFVLYNFGIHDIRMRCDEWESWFKDQNNFNFTDLLFLRSPSSALVHSKIFLVRIIRDATSVRIRNNNDLITFIVRMVNDNEAEIQNIFCNEKTVIDELNELIFNTKGDLQKKGQSFGTLLANYVKKMEKFTNLKKQFNYLYAIPVISSFFHKTSFNRSGLFLPSQKPINIKKLIKIQEIITQPLCHIDYIRDAIILKERIEKEQQKRIETVNRLNKLLSDFQHTLFQKVMETILAFGKQMLPEKNKSPLTNYYRESFTYLCKHIMKRGTYLACLADYLIKPEKEAQTFEDQSGQQIEQFVKCGVFVNSPLLYEDTLKKSLENWEKIVQLKYPQGWSIKTHNGAIETILENLLHNSLIKHFNLEDGEKSRVSYSNDFLTALHSLNFETIRKYLCVHIILEKQNGIPFLAYYDTGKGFKSDSVNNLVRWITDGPSEKELGSANKGYAYWLIGKILKHIKSSIKFTILNKKGKQIENIIPKNYYFKDINGIPNQNLKLENLFNNNIRLIHWLFLKSGG